MHAIQFFRIGEKVVYPNQGVGTVENISTRDFGDHYERFYLLRITATSMTVIVPFSHVGQVGLRKVTGNAEIPRVLAYLGEQMEKPRADWKDRFKENTEKMRSGGLLEIAEVLKTLVLLQTGKPLSFREKKMLDRARFMLVTELSTSMALKELEAVDVLRKTLAKASLCLPAAL